MEEAGREMQAARRMAEVGQANDGEEATGFFSSHFEAPFKKQSETVIRHGDRFAGSQSSVHDGYDWGSLETVAAVKKLQGMGAQVFPPGSKGEINWGALAGKISFRFLSLDGAAIFILHFSHLCIFRLLVSKAPD